MTNTIRLQERTLGPPGTFHPDLPTSPRPVCFHRVYRSVSHHDPVEMVAGFKDTIEITDVTTMICPICGVRRETTVEAACEHN